MVEEKHIFSLDGPGKSDVLPEPGVFSLPAWRMEEGLKAEWVEALRSGFYAQGTEALRSIAGPCLYSYCCLGVLQETIERRSSVLDGEWISPYRLPDEWQTILANLNDSGKSFLEIADFIEVHL